MAPMTNVLRTILPVVLTAALGSLALGCGPEPAPRAPNETRTLDERRAVEVIRRAVAQEGEKPAPAREVELRSGKTLRVDVSIEGREYGIAYISN
jgi:hypothetical protein